MRVERVALNNFLAFREVSIEFAPGLNVVLSPNEGGKSSLFRGIAAGFYANASTKSSEVLSLTRWGSAGRFRIEIDVLLGEASYRLVRDFETKEQTMLRSGETKAFAKGKAVDEFLAEHLPIPDENLFLRVCGVRHEELARVSDGTTAVGEAIEEILGGGWGAATPAAVQRTVEERRKELIRGRDRPVNEANRGLIKRLVDDVERFERDAGKASSLSAAREGLLKRISDLDSKLRILDGELSLLREKRERAAAFRDIEGTERAAREKADALRKRKERLGELFELKRSLATEGARFPELFRQGTPAFLDELRAAFERESLLKKEIGEAAARIETKAPLWYRILVPAFVLAGAFAIAMHEPIGIAFIVIAAGLFALRAVRKERFGAGGPPTRLEVELERLAAQRGDMLGSRSLEDARALLSAFIAWRDRARDVESRIEEVAGGRPVDAEELVEALDREYGEAALDLRAIVESRGALEPFKTDGDGLLRIERELAGRDEERTRLAADRAEADRALAALERMDDAGIAERLALARENLARAERKERVLEAMLEALGEARRSIAGLLAERLPPLAAGHLARITGGRYETLFIDPLTLRVETVPARGDAEEGGGAAPAPERIGPEAISQGARDQLYLAVRLALVELMSGGEPQPVFLDDPFVHFDPERRARALDVVRAFAATHQVVIFTCDPRLREAGGRLVELAPRP
jgi:DNA repair exonuclease SbcCD ATPase subunit